MLVQRRVAPTTIFSDLVFGYTVCATATTSQFCRLHESNVYRGNSSNGSWLLCWAFSNGVTANSLSGTRFAYSSRMEFWVLFQNGGPAAFFWNSLTNIDCLFGPAFVPVVLRSIKWCYLKLDFIVIRCSVRCYHEIMAGIVDYWCSFPIKPLSSS